MIPRPGEILQNEIDLAERESNDLKKIESEKKQLDSLTLWTAKPRYREPETLWQRIQRSYRYWRDNICHIHKIKRTEHGYDGQVDCLECRREQQKQPAMKPALQKLLSHVEDAEENIFIFPFLKNILSEEEIESLEKKGVLIKMRDMEKISCESCISGEFVNVRINEKGRIYYTCSFDGSRQYIDPKKLRQWKVDSTHLPKHTINAMKE